MAVSTYHFFWAVSDTERRQSRFSFDVLKIGILNESCTNVTGVVCRRVWRHQNVADGEASVVVAGLQGEVCHKGKDESLFFVLTETKRPQQFDKFDDFANIFVSLENVIVSI